MLTAHLKGIGVLPGVYKTQGFGENPEVYKKFGLAFHNGDDYAAPEGTFDYASHDGIIDEVGFDKDGYGNYVKYKWQEHGYEYTLLHAHHNLNKVKVGDVVKAGITVIGTVGSTGFSTGPHVHRTLKIHKNGQLLFPNNGVNGAIDPESYGYMTNVKLVKNGSEYAFYVPATQEATLIDKALNFGYPLPTLDNGTKVDWSKLTPDIVI